MQGFHRWAHDQSFLLRYLQNMKMLRRVIQVQGIFLQLVIVALMIFGDWFCKEKLKYQSRNHIYIECLI